MRAGEEYQIADSFHVTANRTPNPIPAAIESGLYQVDLVVISGTVFCVPKLVRERIEGYAEAVSYSVCPG